MSALPFERAPGVGILTFYSISLTVTALATGLIFLRVVSVVKQSEGRVGSYALTMEVVVESGVLYTVALVVTAVFLMEGCCFASEDNMALPITASFWTQALPAVTVRSPHITKCQWELIKIPCESTGHRSNIDHVPCCNRARQG